MKHIIVAIENEKKESCKGCYFEERCSTGLGILTESYGLPNCDDGYIYQIKKVKD